MSKPQTSFDFGAYIAKPKPAAKVEEAILAPVVEVKAEAPSNLKLMLGDCLVQLKNLPDNSVDSIVTDPPYGLSFMGKKWDYDVPTTAIWEECLRVLKPGGHLLSFSSTRTYHRMAVNVEDAGFEIRDQIMWLYGSGFPKSHNVGKSALKLVEEELLKQGVGVVEWK